MKRMFSSIIILVGLMVAFSAHAWMDDWAPAFNCTPAEAEELSEANVSNFVSKVRFEDMDFYWQYCKGYKLDLNGDGIKDFVYILPWMGCTSMGSDTDGGVECGGAAGLR